MEIALNSVVLVVSEQICKSGIFTCALNVKLYGSDFLPTQEQN